MRLIFNINKNYFLRTSLIVIVILLYLPITFGQVCFNPYTLNYTGGNGPGSIVSSDFDGDGHLDLATANRSTDNISIIFGNGDGTFTQPWVNGVDFYAAGQTPSYIALGDFDEDTITDLVVSNQVSNNISIFMGTDSGHFDSAIHLPVGSHPIHVLVEDFNNDDHLDIITTNFFSFDISVFLGYGDGSFDSVVNYSAGSWMVNTSTGDFNNDGIKDLVIPNGFNYSYLILLGTGNGIFDTVRTYNVNFYPFNATAALIDNDSIWDLAFADADDSVHILFGSGNGNFSKHTRYLSGSDPSNVYFHDLNNDSLAELIAVDYGSNGISVFQGQGNGTFGSKVSYGGAVSPSSLAIGDFNEDGFPDIAIPPEQGDGYGVLINCSVLSGISFEEIPENEKIGNLKIYPNPFTDESTVLIPFVETPSIQYIKVNIYNSNGKEVRKSYIYNFEQIKQEISFKIKGEMPSGIYVLKVEAISRSTLLPYLYRGKIIVL